MTGYTSEYMSYPGTMPFPCDLKSLGLLIRMAPACGKTSGKSWWYLAFPHDTGFRGLGIYMFPATGCSLLVWNRGWLKKTLKAGNSPFQLLINIFKYLQEKGDHNYPGRRQDNSSAVRSPRVAPPMAFY